VFEDTNESLEKAALEGKEKVGEEGKEEEKDC